MKTATIENPATRRTRQRAAIRTALERTARPLSPLELLRLARRGAPGLGIATVYRAMKTLVAEGHAQTVTLPEGPRRYEAARPHHHHHFACRRCRRVFEMEGCPRNLARLAPPGFRVDAHELVLYGACRDCGRRR